MDGSKLTKRTVNVYKGIYKSVQKTRHVLRDPPLVVLHITNKPQPTTHQVQEQTRLVVEDYVYSRLQIFEEAEELNEPTLTDVSREVQAIGAELERTYPGIYKDVHRQLNVYLKSEVILRRCLQSLAESMLKETELTWCRLVSFIATAGALAKESFQQDQLFLISVIIESTTEIIDRFCNPWIRQQGGWIDITKTFRTDHEVRRLWTITGLGAVVGFIFMWLTVVKV